LQHIADDASMHSMPQALNAGAFLCRPIGIALVPQALVERRLRAALEGIFLRDCPEKQAQTERMSVEMLVVIKRFRPSRLITLGCRSLSRGLTM